MLAIRLSRTGKIHAPHYRIVVQERRSKLNGKTVDIIGHYHPTDKDKLLVIDEGKANLWLGRGAQASDTVTNLLVKKGILDASHRVARYVAPKTEATPEAKEATESKAPAEEEVAEPTTEEPVVEGVSPEEVAAPVAEAPEAEENTVTETPAE